jgi:hypothetical protein
MRFRPPAKAEGYLRHQRIVICVRLLLKKRKRVEILS